MEWRSSEWAAGNSDLRLDARLKGRSVYILLPAYNEEEGIEKLHSRIDRICRTYAIKAEVVIVNDGSADHTRAVIRSFAEMPITLIDFPKNRGIAAVFSVGFPWVLDRGGDGEFCITLDADNTHSPYVMLDVLAKLLEGNEVVIASRFQPGGEIIGIPLYRRVMSNAVSLLLRWIAASLTSGTTQHFTAATASASCGEALMLRRSFDRGSRICSHGGLADTAWAVDRPYCRGAVAYTLRPEGRRERPADCEDDAWLRPTISQVLARPQRPW